MGETLALVGWVAAAAASGATLLLRRELGRRRAAVAAACHELRGPLTAITLGLELAGRQGGLPAGGRRAIELELGRAALALEDLEGLRRRPDSPEDVPVDVRELVAGSVEAWRPVAEKRGIELRLRWSGEDVLVPGDRLRLAQAIGNLLANAIEHGGKEIEVRGGAAARTARIEVLDRGPGLEAPVAELIRRGSPDARRGHGLRIADAIATAHRGRLAAAPGAGGARVVLELPLGLAAGPAQAEHR